jgi:hypothetical protein
VGRDTLEQRESVADPVRDVGGKVWWRKEGIDGHYLLKEGGHDAYRGGM